MKTVMSSKLLKTALTADAVVSGTVAALQLAAPEALSRLLVLPRPLLVETGVFLVAYTVLLIVLARGATVGSALIGVIVLGNVGWAVGCAALLATGAVAPSAPGMAFIVVQAAAVLVFAALEFAGLKASVNAPGSLAARA